MIGTISNLSSKPDTVFNSRPIHTEPKIHAERLLTESFRRRLLKMVIRHGLAYSSEGLLLRVARAPRACPFRAIPKD